ncbi:MAG: hypothetical protein OEV42_03945 [Deltaproteobacteria bacterium]|nr:hypothetical protein [Deltaproteobacteria bacterium]
MTEAKQKDGEFDEWLMRDMCNHLESHTSALEALAELICSSTLEAFTGETGGEHKSANLRWGLLQIFQFYLEGQQKILEEYLDKFNNLDLVLLKRGEKLLELVHYGAYTNEERAHEMLKEAIGYLDVVIGRDSELKEVAQELKGKCLERMGGD